MKISRREPYDLNGETVPSDTLTKLTILTMIATIVGGVAAIPSLMKVRR